MVIDKTGQAKVKGECYDCCLPNDNSHSSFTDVMFHKDDDKKKKKITHCTGARILSTYVTDDNKLFV
jgi:hypothetical protein